MSVSSEVRVAGARDRVLWIALLASAPMLFVLALMVFARAIGRQGGLDRGDTYFPEFARRILAAGFVGAACIALPKPSAFSTNATVRRIAKTSALLIAVAVWVALARPIRSGDLGARTTESAALVALLFGIVIASRSRPRRDAPSAAGSPRLRDDPAADAAWIKRERRKFLLALAGLAGLAALAFLPVLRPWLGATTFELPLPFSDRDHGPLSIFEMSVGLYALAATLRPPLIAPKGWRFARTPVMSADERRAWRRCDFAIFLSFVALYVFALLAEATVQARVVVVRERVQPLAAALSASTANSPKGPPKQLEELGLRPVPAGTSADPKPCALYGGDNLVGFAYRVATWDGLPAHREAWLVYTLPGSGLWRTREGWLDLKSEHFDDARIVREDELATDAQGKWRRITLERD